MTWTFERVFYGNREGLNLKSMRDFLLQGYYSIPYTLLDGYYRSVHRVGEHDSIYAQVTQPFPDVLLAQRPQGKFALHLSGGFDSAILAQLYDRADIDYIHFTGPESIKARALAATLKGTLHEILITPGLFLETAEQVVPRLPEPYAFEDIVYAYLASKKAKELGHTLVVAGDGGDGVFGGAYVGPYSRKACIVWKTIDPNRLLGLQTLQPYMHTALYAWSKTTLSPRQAGYDKRFAAEYCRQLGMPREICEQVKVPWGGSHGIRTHPDVIAHFTAAIDNSDYAWIRQFEFPRNPAADLLFRQYGLVRWLQTNYKPRLEPSEIRQQCEQFRQFNAQERDTASTRRRKEAIKQYCPPAAVRLANRFKNRLLTVRPNR
jgi:hypothetical protein